jgi:chromosome segregation ATPase
VADALERTGGQLRASDAAAGQLREELAGALATNAALERQLTDARADLVAEQRRGDAERREHAGKLEKAGERAQLAEERFADMEKRALLEIDRERTAAAKLQKLLDTERAAHAAGADRLRADYKEAQSSIAQLRERVGAIQNSVATLTGERDRALGHLQETRAQLESAIGQAAAEGARAADLRDEVARLRARQEARLAVGSSSANNQKDEPGKKRRRKAVPPDGGQR